MALLEVLVLSLFIIQETPAEGLPWLGAWKHAESGDVIVFEAERCMRLMGGEPRFYRARHTERGVELEQFARPSRMRLALMDGDLRVGGGQGDVVYERMDEIPAELLIPAVEVAAAEELDADLVTTVQEEMLVRGAKDQRVRTHPQEFEDPQSVDRDNTEFLLGLIAEVGWIDVKRFGPEANNSAFLIVQHSGHLSLMKTVLPLIEADVKTAGADGQAFALLYDRLQLGLGYRQRYGSQIHVTPAHEYVLAPLEDRERVDEFRAELGMTPLADYLALFEAHNGGRPIRYLPDVPPEEIGADHGHDH